MLGILWFSWFDSTLEFAFASFSTHNFFFFFRAAPMTYQSSQARGRIGAVATNLRHSHSNARSELRLQPTPQLTAKPDPEPTEQGQGSNPHLHGS